MDIKEKMITSVKSLPKEFVAELKKINWRKAKISWMQLVALLSYLNILVVIPMMFAKKDRFIQYHAKQGMALLVVWVLFIFSFFAPVLPIIFGFYLALAIVIGWTNVLANKQQPLPLIGKLV